MSEHAQSPEIDPQPTSSRGRGSLNRQIIALALPAFGALVAEPLFVLGDTAIVGHLGSAQLAGLTLGSTVIQTVVGLMVFLSYSTTPAVARAFGAGKMHDAYRAGRDGAWAALLIGVVLAGAGWILTVPLLRALGGTGEIVVYAEQYLRPSWLGLPAMLLVLALTGALRGFQDTKSPLYVAAVGAAVNLGLSWVLVYPAGWGVAGSAVATVIIQWLMALVLVLFLVRGFFRHGVGLGPEAAGVMKVFSLGSWLMLRTLSMRLALLATVFVVTRQGVENLAAYQLTMSFFSFLAYALDSLAIAAQALLGKEMGASDVASPSGRAAVLELKDRLVRWSLWFGVVTGALCPLVGFGGAWIFTSDSQVQYLFSLALLVVALGQPLAAYVFVLDGVLIGAQDFRYLALAACAVLCAYLPMLLAVALVFGRGSAEGPDAVGFVWLWAAYAVGYMGLRALTLGWRVRKGTWF